MPLLVDFAIVDDNDEVLSFESVAHRPISTASPLGFDGAIPFSRRLKGYE